MREMASRCGGAVRAWVLGIGVSGAAAFVGCASEPAASTTGPATAPAVEVGQPMQPYDCPAGLPAGARCLRGRDAIGAAFVAALPPGWRAGDGVLVVHAHGGPDLGPATHRRAEADLERWAVTVQAGYAWVGASYRRGGLGVTMAAEDVERSRQAFVAQFGQPRRTLLHGQSYGAGVAAKAAELYAPLGAPADAPRRYDGLVLTSGVLGGGVAAYGFRLDLRAVYQAVCGNHPAPDEPAYPLWQGLPPDARLSPETLSARVRACTGIGLAPADRSDAQRRDLRVILDAVPIEERSLLPHLQWATRHFQDLTLTRLEGRNPFDNTRTDYRHAGTDADRAAFNARVPRYAADPVAVATLDADSRPTGRTALPTLTLHGTDDPTAFVELEGLYREIRARAGTESRLVQTYTVSREHSFLHAPEYPALFASLLDWVDGGPRPTPDTLLARCRDFEPTFGASGATRCGIAPGWTPRPLAERLPPRR